VQIEFDRADVTRGRRRAPLIAKHLGWENAQQLLDMPDYRAIGKFLESGQPTEPVPIALPHLPPIDGSHADALIARSPNERSRPREAVEVRLERFLGGKTRKTHYLSQIMELVPITLEVATGPGGKAEKPLRQKHHYIPVFYLKQWAGQDGRVCEFSRPYEIKADRPIPDTIPVKPRRTHPDGTGFIPDLYTFASLNPELANFLEGKFLRQADNRAAIVLRRTLKHDLDFDEPTRCNWSRFVMTLFHRTPEGLDLIRQRLEQHLPRFVEDIRERYAELRRNIDPENVADFISKWGTAESDEISLCVLHHVMDSEPVGTLLNRMVWAVITFDDRHHPLLTGDRPIILYGGLSHPQGRLLIPLSPRTIFVAANDQDLIQKTNNDSQSSGLAQRINSKIARQAQKYVYAVDHTPLQFVEGRLGDSQMFPVGNNGGVGRWWNC